MAQDPAAAAAGLLARYRDAAERTADPEVGVAMTASLEVHALFKQLRESAEGRAGISALSLDANPHVRRWAATHTLMWNREAGRATLRGLNRL